MSTIVKDFTVNARYDLQAPSVQIFYETASSINDQESLALVKDFYPNPLPTDPRSQFASLQFTVDLQGIQASVATAKLVVDDITPTDPNWWLAKHPQYKPFDSTNPADAHNNIASFNIDPSTIARIPTKLDNSQIQPVTDHGYIRELNQGQLTDWMAFKSQRITFAVRATIVHRNGTQPQQITLTYQCLTTDATSGAFNHQTITAFPEPIPIGLARFLYDAVSVLQFEGQLTLQEEDVSGSLLIGNLFNLTGGALAEWSSMAAMVQSVTENIDNGTTTIQFGPPRNLSAGELVDLLRVNRTRLITSQFSMRIAGAPGNSGGSVDLGQNTPEKNSVSGTAPANPQVISATVDGTGAVIQHTSLHGGLDCSSVWQGVPVPGSSAPPPPGSVDISLSDTNGADLYIQPLNVCLNGIPGTMYFLCSNFVPDQP